VLQLQWVPLLPLLLVLLGEPLVLPGPGLAEPLQQYAGAWVQLPARVPQAWALLRAWALLVPQAWALLRAWALPLLRAWALPLA
jgi:hypothetical protein